MLKTWQIIWQQDIATLDESWLYLSTDHEMIWLTLVEECDEGD
jgi:hypothetical protein